MLASYDACPGRVSPDGSLMALVIIDRQAPIATPRDHTTLSPSLLTAIFSGRAIFKERRGCMPWMTRRLIPYPWPRRIFESAGVPIDSPRLGVLRGTALLSHDLRPFAKKVE